MRKYIVLFYLSVITIGFSQNPEIKSELPNVMPPSPTVAALMKYNEIEVSEYTGVPDISLTLFESKARSSKVNSVIKLSYHIANIKADDVSTDVGLGWSLSYGGTISRITKDLPDEINVFKQSSFIGIQWHSGRIGIYHNNPGDINNPDGYSNLFYDFLNFERGNNNVSISDYNRRKFYWQDISLGRYDTEHDVWQYNFMGYNGNFTIEKNVTTNLLEVKNKTVNGLKIVNIYNGYTPVSFIVYDPYGNQFVFDVIENSISSSFIDNKYYNHPNTIAANGIFVSIPMKVRSAFHLSKVFDKNNNLILEYIYNDDNEKVTEITEVRTFEYNYPIGVNEPQAALFYMGLVDTHNINQQNKVLEPIQRFNVNKVINDVKKVKEIKVVGYGKYTFEWDSNRSDFTELGYVAYKLNSITERNLEGEIQSKYVFNYFYNDKNVYNRNKMFLEKLDKYDKNVQNYTTQKFEYEFLDHLTNLNLGVDYWGYHNDVKPYDFKFYTKKVSPIISTLGILKKIVHPTKGCTVFEYEPNSYSYIGDQPLTNFNDNPDNWDENVIHLDIQTLNTQYNLFHILDSQDIEINVDANSLLNNFSDFRFNIFKRNNQNNFVLYKSIESETVLSNNYFFSTNLTAGEYKITLTSMDLSFPSNFSLNLDIIYKTRKENQLNFLYGGGNRIKSIRHFDEDIDLNNFYLEIPKKKMSYSYQKGSLAYGLPIFEYTKTVFTLIRIRVGNVGAYFENVFEIKYKTISTSSINFNFKTHGSDIGYESVKKYEFNNGVSGWFF